MAPLQGFHHGCSPTQGVALGYHLLPRWGKFSGHPADAQIVVQNRYHLLPRWGKFSVCFLTPGGGVEKMHGLTRWGKFSALFRSLDPKEKSAMPDCPFGAKF
jgi:hypothetical protein